MKPPRWLLLAPLVGAALPAVFLGVVVLVSALIHPRLPSDPGTPGPLEWVGVLHTHTDRSHDGGGTLDELVDAAHGMDFLLVTDHGQRGLTGSHYRESLLLLAGEEVSTRDGHLVVVGTEPIGSLASDAPPGPAVGPDQGFRIAAHPMGRTRWTAWGEGHFDGMEIWNADTERRGDGLGEWLHALALVPLRPVAGLYQLLDYPSRNLAAWDSLTRRRRVPGFCAVDAHNSLPLPWGLDLHFPRYRHSLAVARQHVFLAESPSGDALRDAALVTDALRQGRSFCAFSGLADARGAQFRVRSAGQTVGLGDSVAWSPDAHMEVQLPPAGEGATLRLIRDGRVVAEGRGPDWQAELTGPGVYRVEVFLELGRRMPWILANPVWVVGG